MGRYSLTCTKCKEPFEAGGPNAKLCEACGGAPRKIVEPKPTQGKQRLSVADMARASELEQLVSQELADNGLQETVLGKASILIARRLEAELRSIASPASGIAALAKEFRAMVGEALGYSKESEVDPIDEIRKRRERKLGNGN